MIFKKQQLKNVKDNMQPTSNEPCPAVQRKRRGEKDTPQKRQTLNVCTP